MMESTHSISGSKQSSKSLYKDTQPLFLYDNVLTQLTSVKKEHSLDKKVKSLIKINNQMDIKPFATLPELRPIFYLTAHTDKNNITSVIDEEKLKEELAFPKDLDKEGAKKKLEQIIGVEKNQNNQHKNDYSKTSLEVIKNISNTQITKYKELLGDFDSYNEGHDYTNHINDNLLNVKYINLEIELKTRESLLKAYKVIFDKSLKIAKPDSTEKIYLLLTKLPDADPQESRYGLKKGSKKIPMIYHLFERHPMDYLRIIEAYNKIQPSDDTKIPEADYLDTKTKKLIEIDDSLVSSSAEKFLDAVNGIILGMIGCPHIKQSTEQGGDNGLNMMVELNKSKINQLTDGIFKNYMLKSYEDKGIGQRQPKYKARSVSVHAFLTAKAYKSPKADDSSQVIQTLEVATIFSEDPKSHLFYHANALQQILFTSNKLIGSQKADSSENTGLIPKDLQMALKKDFEELQQNISTFLKNDYDGNFSDLQKQSAYLKSDNATADNDNDNDNGRKSIIQQEEKNLHKKAFTSVNEQIKNLSGKLGTLCKGEQLSGDAKITAKKFIKDADAYQKKYNPTS